MAARYYVAQVNYDRAGWMDLQGSASQSKKFADDFAEFIAHAYTRHTRTLRKPHGWEPKGEYGVEFPHGPTKS